MRSLTHETSGQETPVLELGETTDGADYAFEIKAVGGADGQELAIALDPVKGELEPEVRGHSGPTEYGVVIRRIEAGGEQTFTHTGSSVAEGAWVTFAYASREGPEQRAPGQARQGRQRLGRRHRAAQRLRVTLGRVRMR